MRVGSVFFAPHRAKSSVAFNREVSPEATCQAPARKPFPVAASAAYLLLFWLIAVLLQVRAGAYHTELAGYPDEPSHYVTGLMLRDYIVSGFPTSPIAFATEYYRHYPKVAFGHWPPFFHMLEASWMILFTASRTSVMLLMAIFTALSAIVLTTWFAKLFGNTAGIISGLIWVSLPVIQEQTSMVMIEMLFTAVTLLALAGLSRYLEQPSRSNALWFSILTLLSIMTKGNGWLLLPAIVLALLLTRQLRLMFDRSMLVAAAIIAIAVPWQLLTAKSVFTALPMQVGLGYSAQSFLGFAVATLHTAGPVVCLVALIGVANEIVVPILRYGRTSAAAATMAGLLCGFVLLHCIVPAGVELRKLIVVLPAILYFALSGTTTALAAVRKTSPLSSSAIAAVVILTSMIVTDRIGLIPTKPGYGLASGWLSSRKAASTWLVSGTPSFEGAAVAEAAMLGDYRRRIVFRAFKVMAQSDWNAREYKSHFHSVSDVRTMLEHAPVELIAVETTASGRAIEHNALLIQALKELPELWRPVPQAGEPGRCEIFLRTAHLSTADFQDRLREMLMMQKPGTQQGAF